MQPMISATFALGSNQPQKRTESGRAFLTRFVGVLLLCGCYTYSNEAVSDAALLAPVRVELTEQGSAEITSQVGPRGSMLEGVVAAKSDSALVFEVSALTRFNGVEETWHGEHVTVPTLGVSKIQRRKFSALNTGLFIAGLVTAGFLVKTVSDPGDVGRNSGGPPSGPGQ
jgi:hypothetical protein